MSTVPESTITLDEKSQTAKLTFMYPFTGSSVTIRFSGYLNDVLAGFYRSMVSEGKYMAVTQFEATDARRCFPCVDEPAVKATFDATLYLSPELEGLSNMPVIRSALASGPVAEQLGVPAEYREWKFDTSPVMSTYLLAFVIGNFDFISDRTDSGVLLRVYVTPGKIEMAKFALDVATKALVIFEELFGIPFPLPKIDLIGIPDFAAGAMENWGLITYRETRLLIDEENSSLEAKKSTARTISHELAHMWFGNLVTMEWWSYLWLNEGFARYMEFMAVDAIFPEWNVWTMYVDSVYCLALRLASMESTHPVEVEVNHPEEISSSFDAITYAMGSAVIRMLNCYVGEANFFKGIHQYLTKFAYSNTLSTDLWAAIDSSTGDEINVSALMDDWIHFDGYPVLSVEEVNSIEGNRSFKLSQNRFLSSGKVNETSCWKIPITVGDSVNNIVFKTLLTTKDSTISFQCDPSLPLKFNLGQSGVYRVHYSTTKTLDALETGVRSRTLSSIDRIGILDDIHSLSKSGIVPVTRALEVSLWYSQEEDLTVLDTLTTHLNSLLSLHSDEPYFASFQEVVSSIFSPIYDRIGWSDENSELRRLVLSVLGSCAHCGVVSESLRRFDQFCSNPDEFPLDPNCRGEVYKIAAKHHQGDVYELLLNLYNRTDLAEEQSRVLQHIGSVTGACDRVWELMWSGKVRSNVLIVLASGLAKSSEGRDLLWNLVSQDWDRVEQVFGGGGGFLIGAIVKVAISGFRDLDKAKEIENHFGKSPRAAITRRLNEGLEVIRLNSTRLVRERGTFTEYFQ